MKTFALVALVGLNLLSVCGARAQSLKALLTEEEWKSAGLDRLTSAELNVIDAALTRHNPTDSTRAKTTVHSAPTAPPTAIMPAPTGSPAAQSSPVSIATTSLAPRQTQSQPTPTPAASSINSAAQPPSESSRGLLSRFGLPDFKNDDWRKLPPLQAKVLSWESANRFVLDNGQTWEGTDPIPDELVGRLIEIHARPNNRFTLVLDGQNTKIRVVRVR